MNRILTAAALIAISAGSALAMSTPSDVLPSTSKSVAQSLVPNADFDNLTAAQVNAIEAILYGDNENRGGQIRAILQN
ncbi:MAG: hypothetical protein KDE08_09230 [Rhodobacteraceae bacterium]|nr:hypothetical protein [Paracoccaceae bacterium]